MSSNLDFELKHATPTKKAVLLFHGMTGSPFEMKKFAKHLHNNGFDVYAYCLPGHGDHPTNIRTVKWTDWVDFSLEKYNNLRDKYDEFYLSGLCMGAVLALNIAQKAEDVSGVICLSTTLFLDGWTIPWYNFLMPLGLNTILRYYYSFPEREPYGIKNEDTRKKISKLMSRNTVALDYYPMSCVYELLKLSKYTRKYMKKVKTPLLLIHAERDDLTSPKSANFVYKTASSEIKEMIILHDSYHLVVYDNEKDLVFNKSVEFLNSLSQEELTLSEAVS